MCSFISFPYIRDGGMTSFLATTLPAALHDTTIEGHPTLDVSPMPNASCGVSIRM